VNRSDWNLHADEFETTVCDIVARETNNQIAKLVGIACKSRKDPILVDLGCGLGSFIKKFSPRFAKIFAFDFAARIVTRARRRCARVSNAEWFAMDISRAAKVIGNCADLTVCLNVVTARSSAKRRDLWMSIHEVTRPLGFALIVVPSIESQKMVEVL
jgi:SAM-dependent methyltransferase